TPEAAALIEKTTGAAGERIEVAGIGTIVARGPMVEALQGSARDLSKLGLAGTMRRVGFQSHDGRIFETLTGRGGILVAIRSEPRAADALAVLHSYGGGNAAIGAWTGRVRRRADTGRQPASTILPKTCKECDLSRGIPFAVARPSTRGRQYLGQRDFLDNA